MERLARLGVELLTWPGEAPLRSALSRAGVPRLLLIDSGAEPPSPLGLAEDWVQMPTSEEELIAKAVNLLERMAGYATVAPTIGEDRVLRRAEASVALSPSEAKIIGRLLDHLGTIVTREELEGLLWPDGIVPGHRSLDYVVQRLRRRIAELNICISTSRGRGFVIYVDDSVSRR
jgi:DNA-binding response OmpR family regulator